MVGFGLNAVIPGSTLLARGRLVAGLSLIVAALACLTLAVLAALSPVAELAGLGLSAVAGYAALAALASVALWQDQRAERYDPAQVRELHRRAAVAYLRGELPSALSAAHALVRTAAREPGSWSLLALIAGASGDAAAADRAARRARALATSAT